MDQIVSHLEYYKNSLLKCDNILLGQPVDALLNLLWRFQCFCFGINIYFKSLFTSKVFQFV